jgi:RNA polymerase sigma factor (sigma-70 family)
MMPGQMMRVVQFCRRVFLEGTLDETADAHLLERFIQQRDEGAFAVLVQRHAQMVLGVCRRVLRNAHDAEDAFQAVFLVLARKADSIRPRTKVGNWLYGVAYRTALEARGAGSKRRVKERQYGAIRHSENGAGMDDELLAVLDQEVSRLPDHYRTVVVLCDLEQRTRKEAALQLGCKEGTVASRLDRARTLLRKRLIRQGVALSGVALVALLSAQAAEAAVTPALLAEATAKGGTDHSQAVQGASARKVVALADRVIRSLEWRRFKTILGSILVVILLGFVILLVMLFRPTAPVGAPPEPASPALVAGDPAPEISRNLTEIGLLREDKIPLPVYSLAFSPDGRSLAVGTGRVRNIARADGAEGVGVVTMIAVDSGKELARIQRGLVDPVTALAFAPDGRRLAGASRPPPAGGSGQAFDRAQIHLWGTADQRELGQPLEVPHGEIVNEVLFSSDGERLAIAQAGQRARLFDMANCTETALPAAAVTVRRIDFSANGKVLALLSASPTPKPKSVLRLWDSVNDREIARWQFPGEEASLFKLAPRGSLVAVAFPKNVLVMDRKKELADRIIPVAGTPRALAFAPGGRNLAIALSTGETLLLDGRSGEIRQTYPLDPEHPLVTCVAFSPDGSLLVVGSCKEDGEGALRFWRGPRTAFPGWGQVVNLDGDCTFETDQDGLVIHIPAKVHDLSVELNRLNAPRVLQEVEGDFSIQVKVRGVLHPTTSSIVGRLPYESGGLLLWSDNRNYLRLERAGLVRDGKLHSLAAFEVRERGELGAARVSEIADADTYLHLERKGNRFLGQVSSDGQRWTSLEPIEAEFPARVRIGVAAVNAAQQPVTVRFEGLTIGR